ncbi:MAG: alpha-galactosidase [Victivallaceae bacterium]|nr:alpha-galactosidase [Victivallaceae bacterium]
MSTITVPWGEIIVSGLEGSGWTFSAKATAEADGIDLIEIALDAPEERILPQTILKWQAPANEIVMRWTPENIATTIPPDWGSERISNLSGWMPLVLFLDDNGINRIAAAFSDAMRKVKFAAGLREEGCVLQFQLTLFSEPEAPSKHFDGILRIDRRQLPFAETLREMTAWYETIPGYELPAVPDAAFEPLYSTWYDFHQEVFADQLEKEFQLAADYGMGSLIVDDGWQTDDNQRGYAYCGDWKISKRRFPDMRSHVAKVHKMGLKYMIWYSVPFVGYKSLNYDRFKGKYLWNWDQLAASVLDPRFPEVRDFLIETYENAVKEWDLDGLKLDFIDCFRIEGEDPAVKENYQGRDYKTVPDAVDRLMTDVIKRLDALKPGFLVEFRQAYVGPAMLKYGNMFRACDCPCDRQRNRVLTVNLRLTSGNRAVHADMLEWSPQSTPEDAILQFLNILFAVPQLSIQLNGIPAAHGKALRFWIDFWRKHQDVLVKSPLEPEHPQLNYPVVSAGRGRERISACYASNYVVSVPKGSESVYVINATKQDRLILNISENCRAQIFNLYGICVGTTDLHAGITTIEVPRSGFALLQ